MVDLVIETTSNLQQMLSPVVTTADLGNGVFVSPEKKKKHAPLMRPGSEDLFSCYSCVTCICI